MLGDLSVIVEDVRGEAKLLATVGERLPLLAREGDRDRFEPLAQEVGASLQDPGALGDWCARPAPKCRARGGKCAVCVRVIAVGNISHDLAASGIVDLATLSADRLDPASSDEQVGMQAGQGCLYDWGHRDAILRQSSA